jgi:hypothetical protein
MTDLTNRVFASAYGDLLTTTNDGQGLTNVLQNLQDGLGNNSPIQIATNAVNFNRTVGTFQLDSVAITSSASNINQVTQSNPILPGTGSVTLPSGTTGERPGTPTAGEMRFNSTTSMVEYYNGTIWVSV